MELRSKLPGGGATIFSVMSALANKHNAVNLGQGFPDFDCDQELRTLVSHHLNSNKNQYCPSAGLLSLRETLAEKIFSIYDNEINPEDEITITAGATQALFTAISAFVHEGDEVIIIEPAYDCYRPSIQMMGGVCVPYSLSGPDYKVDWEELTSMISERTAMIIINTPHNPIGKTLKKHDLETLEKISQKNDIIILSDEVYEHLIYDDQKHQSVMMYPSLFEKSLAIFSFGKTFHCTGWKIGYAVGPRHIMNEFRKVHQWNVFCVNSFLQYALRDYMKEESNYLHLPNFYQRKRDYLNDLLANSKFQPLKSEGTYFQLFDYSDISDMNDVEFAKYLTTEHGVASIPVSVFSSKPSSDKMIRLCFAKTEEVLERAAELLNKI